MVEGEISLSWPDERCHDTKRFACQAEFVREGADVEARRDGKRDGAGGSGRRKGGRGWWNMGVLGGGCLR